MWKALVNFHQKNGFASRILSKKLLMLQPEEGENTESHLRTFDGIVRQLKSVGKPFCSTACEGVWLRNTEVDLKIDLFGPIRIFGNNQRRIQLRKNPKTIRFKHIDIEYHFIRDKGENKHVESKTQETQRHILRTQKCPRIE
ncbi:hypothetical protein JTB14_008336 [Gonioctena quinquepunctata]|nr:hypothetical protein JTB14_008336 [Gonioctena quinquepunctata]